LMSKIASIIANRSQNSSINHKTADPYESSGKAGFSDVSQAGIIELLCPLHANTPFTPCEAAVFDSLSAAFKP
jgi:hypothetical protein